MAVTIGDQKISGNASWDGGFENIGNSKISLPGAGQPLSLPGVGGYNVSGIPGMSTQGSDLSVMNGMDMSDYSFMQTDTPTLGGGMDLPGNTAGGWLDKNGKGGMALGAAEVGLGIWNATQQQKMNKFMRKYYGNQMDLQNQDFANAAKDTNTTLARQEALRLDARGITIDSDESNRRVAGYMDEHGVAETA